MTVKEFIKHVYPYLSIDIYTDADCTFIEEKQAGSIALSKDKWYEETVVKDWTIYESHAKLWV